MAKLVFLILITVLLTLANTTSVMATDANGITRHDDIIRMNDKLEREESDIYRSPADCKKFEL
jgi:hypothetical protein